MYPSPFLQYWSGEVAFGDRFLHDLNGAPRRAPVVLAQIFCRHNLSFRTLLFFFGRNFQIYSGPAPTKPSSWAKSDWDVDHGSIFCPNKGGPGRWRFLFQSGHFLSDLALYQPGSIGEGEETGLAVCLLCNLFFPRRGFFLLPYSPSSGVSIFYRAIRDDRGNAGNTYRGIFYFFFPYDFSLWCDLRVAGFYLFLSTSGHLELSADAQFLSIRHCRDLYRGRYLDADARCYKPISPGRPDAFALSPEHWGGVSVAKGLTKLIPLRRDDRPS